MKKIFLFLFACLTYHFMSGQDSRKIQIPLGGEVIVSEIENDYHPQLRRLEAPSPGGEGYRSYLEQVKAQLPQLRPVDPGAAGARTAGGAGNPILGLNFNGNNYIDGVPNDNDMAISNDSQIVSVINSNIFWFGTDGVGQGAGSSSLDAWAAPLNLSASKYDPRALYDPIHDRFIIVCLNGFDNTTSHIIVGFSQTSDPTGGWNLYALPGDPNNDTLWTDYPIMALNEHELFITGNLLRNGEPWQTGFEESIAWQIDLDSAYLGGTLDTRLWDNVNFGNGRVRNLCPVQGGSSPVGTNMYFVSNRNFDVANDTVFIMEVTDTINGSPQFTVDYGLTDVDYGMPPNAIQQFTQLLATNDGRWLDAVIENGNIQFVGNCLAPSTGLCGIYHGTITDVANNPVVTGAILTDSTLDYGYPGLAWAGLSLGSEEMMIVANYTGTSTATSYGMFYYDGAGNYSNLIPARSGQSYINVISGVDRWGDYSGIQTKYDEPGVVWAAATWGRFNRQGGTWIAEYRHPTLVKNEVPKPVAEVKTFPNPVTDRVVVEFNVESDVFGEIYLTDQAGRVVRTFIKDRLRSGLNEFRFSTEPLANGLYYLVVKADGVVFTTKKIVKAAD